MACARCNAPNAEFFTPEGDQVCRACFSAAQNAQAEARARASLERDAPPGFKVAGPGTPPPSPRRLIAGGLAVMGFGVLFALGTVVLFGRVYPIWLALLLLGGTQAVARGLVQLRRG
jgi:hypothetical protein